ncbi:hypothetical protein Tco_0277577 [Tanacetum coccineum]
MNTLLLPVSNLFSIKYYSAVKLHSNKVRCKSFNVDASSNETDTKTVVDNNDNTGNNEDESVGVKNKSSSGATSSVEKDLKKVVQKTAATFAPRASTASKNPAVPGSTLYTVFEVQAYASMLVGGALSFNLIFPSNEPDLWRLMGMWSIWMFSKYYPLISLYICSSKWFHLSAFKCQP